MATFSCRLWKRKREWCFEVSAHNGAKVWSPIHLLKAIYRKETLWLHRSIQTLQTPMPWKLFISWTNNKTMRYNHSPFSLRVELHVLILVIQLCYVWFVSRFNCQLCAALWAMWTYLTLGCQPVSTPNSYSITAAHYNDVIMSAVASQITSLTTVYSTVYSDADQRKHQSFASLVFETGIHRWLVNSPHKGPVTRKIWWRHHESGHNQPCSHTEYYDIAVVRGYRRHVAYSDLARNFEYNNKLLLFSLFSPQ